MIASDSLDEEGYIKRAVEELAKLSELKTNRFAPANGTVQSDLQAWVVPLILVQFRMSPNSVIRLHDHRHQNGVISVREGHARVRSFDLFEEEGDKRWDVAAGKLPGRDEEFLVLQLYLL